MAKFINVPLQDLLDSGTDATGTASKLTVADTSTFSVGDYVHNTTDDTYASITAIDSGTVASLSADIMDAAENYAVYSASVSSVSRLISAEHVLLADQASAAANAIGATTVTYATNGADVLTITHTGNLLATVEVADAVDQAVKDAHSSAWYKTVDLVMPSGTGVFTLAIA
jgi:predicted proteasome-type protease